MSPAILLFAAALLGSDSPAPTPQPATPANPAPAKAANPRVAFETTLGKIVIELDPEKAPKTVENFLAYVKSGFYDGTIFHRVIPGFMIQGGGFTPDMQQKKTQPPIANEADNGLKNKRGTLSMARTNDPMSATSQFFINVNDNRPLDYTAKTPGGWGYAVFAKVVEGMDVADKIVNVKRGNRGQFGDVPETTVEIQKATLLP
ncbi:MAG: peptidylprolyl isomerase [Thermoanaerobaculia bacterium]